MRFLESKPPSKAASIITASWHLRKSAWVQKRRIVSSSNWWGISKYIFVASVAYALLALLFMLLDTLTPKETYNCATRYVGWYCSSNCTAAITNSTSMCQALQGERGYDLGFQYAVVLITAGGLSMLGAGFLILSFLASKKCHGQVHTMLIFNLAVADFMLAAACIVDGAVLFLSVGETRMRQQIVSVIWNTYYWLFIGWDTSWVLTIAFNLFLMLAAPLRYRRWSRKKWRLMPPYSVFAYGPPCGLVALHNFGVLPFQFGAGIVVLVFFFCCFVFVFTLRKLQQTSDYNRRVSFQALSFVMAHLMLALSFGIEAILAAPTGDHGFGGLQFYRFWSINLAHCLPGFLNFLVWRDHLNFSASVHSLSVRVRSKWRVGNKGGGSEEVHALADAGIQQ